MDALRADGSSEDPEIAHRARITPMDAEIAALEQEIAENTAQTEKAMAKVRAYDKLLAEKEAYNWKIRRWLAVSSYTRGTAVSKK